MKMTREVYNSIEILLDTIKKREVNRVFGGKDTEKSKLPSHKGTNGFCGTRNFEEAEDLIKHGWIEPLEKIKKNLGSGKVRSTTGEIKKIRPSAGIVGYAPLVPNAILGLPHSMIKSERTPMKIKTITLLYAVSVNASIDKDVMIDAGISTLRIVNDLELKGYRVQVELEFIGTHAKNREFASGSVVVKSWRDALDLKKLAFPMVHPSMLRRIAFLWLETVPNLTDNYFSWGHGIPVANQSYESAKEFYEKRGILNDQTYYINPIMCQEEGYDPKRIMQRIGMSQVLEKGA
jgi:hypothetical protein